MDIFEHLGRQLIAHQDRPLTALGVLFVGPSLVAATALLLAFDHALSPRR